MSRIYVVEDNESVLEAVLSYLRLDDHEAAGFPRIESARKAIRAAQPDLLILDVMLPDGDGFLFARSLKRDYSFPILFLTARSAESDRVTGLEMGADDYVVKPFSPKELALRVKSILKRSGSDAVPRAASAISGRWTLDGSMSVLEADEAAHRLRLDGTAIELTANEWKILSWLMLNHGILASREKLLFECLDYSAEGSERTIDTHVKNLRAKLDDRGNRYTGAGNGRLGRGERQRRRRERPTQGIERKPSPSGYRVGTQD